MRRTGAAIFNLHSGAHRAKHVSMTTWITICETCKRDDWAARGMEHTDGELLAAEIETRAGAAGVKTRRVACTMGCERACNIIVQGEDETGTAKMGYSLGKFDGTAEDAAAIVEYAALHAASPTGQVPFRTWPQGVKGHFVSRHLPLPTESDT
ncbi:Predicted metal-binding protein [Celeribacter marinus]|nr:Predicted metal-binding protein [Celeribacter marinus]